MDYLASKRDADSEFRDEAALREKFWNVKSGDVVIDVGCGYGSYAVPAVVAGATVYAIDANEAVLDALVDRARDSTGRLVALHLAIYNGGQYPGGLMGEIESRDWCSRPHNDIQWTTLDALVQTYGLARVDWVKIDVEGGEAGVLRGGLKMLCDLRPRLLIEDHSGIYRWVARNSSAGRIRKLLADVGYTVKVVPYVGPGLARNYFVCI